MMRKSCLILACLVALCVADTYLHNPRGSNDRNCERNENRNNGNLLFDSQNNAKGGYACPRAVGGPEVVTPRMYYTAGSVLPIEWTMQHGCGGNTKTNCEVVLQYACENSLDPAKTFRSQAPNEANRRAYGVAVDSDVAGENTDATTTVDGVTIRYVDKLHIVGSPRDGTPRDADDAATDQIPENNNGVEAYASDVENRRYTVHETFDSYKGGMDATATLSQTAASTIVRKRKIGCDERERNKGLFNADQKLNGDSAKYTRQNPNGNRNGLECPEESEYYPYWHPTPWKDIAILTDVGDTQSSVNSQRCKYYQQESQNVKAKYECEYDETSDTRLDYVIAFGTAETDSDVTEGGYMCLEAAGNAFTTTMRTCNRNDNDQKFYYNTGDVLTDDTLENHIVRQTAVNGEFRCLDFDATGTAPFNLVANLCDPESKTQKWTWVNGGSSTASAQIRSNYVYSEEQEGGGTAVESLCIDTGSGAADDANPAQNTQATVTYCTVAGPQQQWWQIHLTFTEQTITNLRNGGDFPNNRVACLMYGQNWQETAAYGLAKPECLKTQLSRANQLGNAADESLTFSTGSLDDDAVPQTINANRYLWTVPNDIDENCVLRLRYNISTTDYEDWNDATTNNVGLNADGISCKAGGCSFSAPGVDASHNGEDNSPITQDPYIQVGPNADTDFLSLAMNTNQYSRTFQDRSYVFAIRPKPAGTTGTVYNLNVRGKRGNIVQTYPSVEYDFTPNALQINQNDNIHFQWSGSDYNPRRGPNDAEGGPNDPNTLTDNNNNARADRSNFVQMMWATDNQPAEMDYTETEWGSPKNVDSIFAAGNGVCDDTCQEKTHRMAMLHQVEWLSVRTDGTAAERQCYTQDELDNKQAGNVRETHPRNCAKLNGQFTPYFDGGMVQMRRKGNFNFQSSRNNNFSNRDQSGSICVGVANGCQMGTVTSSPAAFGEASSVTGSSGSDAGLAAGLFFVGAIIVWGVHFGYAKYAKKSGMAPMYQGDGVAAPMRPGAAREMI